MRVFDRFTGAETDLPPQVEPGRYRLLVAARLKYVADSEWGSLPAQVSANRFFWA